jgi:hypothetical protein
MPFRNALLCLCCLLVLPCAAKAQSTAQPEAGENARIPHIIVSGFEAYKDNKDHGPEEAIKAWLKGGPLEGSKTALGQANTLREIQDYYGEYESFSVISTRDLTSRTKIVYVEIDFERGPAFGKFLVYRIEGGWIMISFDFNTKEDAILPS